MIPPGSDVAVAAVLVCALLLSVIPVGDCLPPPPPSPHPDTEALPLTAAEHDVTTNTRHATTADSASFPRVIETQEKSASLDEGRARTWLQQIENDGRLYIHEAVSWAWAYENNITDENQKKKGEAYLRMAQWKKDVAEDLKQFDWNNFQNDSLKRQFRFAADIGSAAMKNKTKLLEMNRLQSEMVRIHTTAAVHLDKGTKDYEMDPVLANIKATSGNYSHLLAVWRASRDAIGPRIKPLYVQFVALSNEAARDSGYADTGEYWRSFYESATFQKNLEKLMDQLSPLYKQLHAYARRQLKKAYGGHRFPKTGHIPAHLIGSLLGEVWDGIYDLVQPYPNRSAINITAAMQRPNYTVMEMFKTAEDFFTSLGFDPLLPSFWNISVLEKPTDREIVCYASAWDFYNTKDFAIKMCTKRTHEDLVIIHHEIGHIQYFMQYRHQPLMFRSGANPGFHEAVGDTISLSVNTPAHLRKIGLLEEGDDNYLDEINYLMKMAMDKIAFLPYGYLLDQWRWSVFSGDIKPEQYNKKWWELRCRYQGLSPPIKRCPKDFDPGAKFHIPNNTPYIRYFVSYVLQFQFYQALCKAANHTGPLHECDIYSSEPAGQLLRSMLSKGQSIPWPDVLEEMTGHRKLDAGAILEYFRPLQQWLENQNKGAKEGVGWTQKCPHGNQL